MIRDATADDAARCAQIYGPYVVDTIASFELIPPTPAEMADRIRAVQERHAWLVLEEDSAVIGYAYGGPFHERAAYQWASAVSVYLEPGRRRTGAGRALYEALFERLVARGFRMAVAGISLPNEPSLGLHTALGFEPVGTYRRIGWKFGAWHDVYWCQRFLTGSAGAPPEPLH